MYVLQTYRISLSSLHLFGDSCPSSQQKALLSCTFQADDANTEVTVTAFHHNAGDSVFRDIVLFEFTMTPTRIETLQNASEEPNYSMVDIGTGKLNAAWQPRQVNDLSGYVPNCNMICRNAK